ncbi:MAG: type 1 glutamine amidotransferase [Acidimicrobiales bacterium]
MSLTVVVVYPELLGTYGDGGNGTVLMRRAAWRGIPAEVVQAPSDRPLPDGDVYCLGGGEDGPQVQAAEALRSDGRLHEAVAAGATVLAVCAGYQIIGASYPGADGEDRPGVGLLDIVTVKGSGRRAVGEVLADPFDPGLPFLSGFENHSGVTTVGPGAGPLAGIRVGVGNGAGAGEPTEGAVAGRVVGTYLHGPVLARNPALADLLLGWAVAGAAERRGQELPTPMSVLDDAEEQALRAERLAAGGADRPRRARRGR